MADNIIHVENFIGGKFSPSNNYIQSVNPATQIILADIPESSEKDVDLAVNAANVAFKSWSRMPVSQRASYMYKIADLIEANLEEMAQLESRDQGKPLSLARSLDIPRAIRNIRFFADAAQYQFEKSTYMDDSDALNYTSRMPVGVAGLITPWNLPLYLLTFKLAPCIAFGNTCVCKPSEFTSLTAWKFAHLCVEAGLPPGVVNIVFGTGSVGEALVLHPQVHAISFTGSTRIGVMVQEKIAKLHKKMSLELGGKNAAIVFEDADINEAVNTCVRSSFTNQGEVCLCTSRIFVHQSCFSNFVNQFVKLARAYKVGDPICSDTKIGALISRDHMEKVTEYIDQAVIDGGTINCGYKVDQLKLPPNFEQGNFVAPTVVTNVSDTSVCMQEEIFGPVTCIVPFSTDDEVIERVNNVEFGLCASIYSKNVSRVHSIARQLKVGTVWVNCWLLRDLRMPFGGMKASGFGREGFRESLDVFTEVQNICIKM